MNILYLAHRIPFPPDKGDKLRAFHQIEHLARRHRVHLACFVDEPDDMRHVETLRRWCASVVAIPLSRSAAKIRGAWSLACGGTITEGFYSHNRMTSAIEGLMTDTDFDAVVAFSSSMAPYALRCVAVRRVLDLCDLDSAKWSLYARDSGPVMSAVYRMEGARLATREVAWARRFDATTLITRAEAEDLRQVGAAKEVDLASRLHIVGNGVDAVDAASYDPAAAGPVVGFVGQMDYRPNIDAVTWFARTCWPAIRKAEPAARFRIVGRRPARAVRALAAMDGIEVVGEVERAADELRGFAVSVAPLRVARGLQNKVLEAMAAARPVVLTAQAAEGIGGVDGLHFAVADEPDQISATVLSLLNSPEDRTGMGLAARAFVAENHRWSREMERFEHLVTGITASGSGCSAELLRHPDERVHEAVEHAVMGGD